MNPFNRVYIDAAALAHNFNSISSRVGPDVGVMAMVKSDAYGHDMLRAAEIFADSGCSNFGVADLDEGVALREGGCQGAILVFVGFDNRDADYLLSHRLTPVIFNTEDLKRVASLGRRRGQKTPLYLKVDCGMGRLGFGPAEIGQIIQSCASLEVDLQGVISHYPNSDEADSDHSLQAHRLLSSIKPPPAQSTGSAAPFSYSICNSGGILYFPQTHGDLVRAGISLYGYYPDGKAGRARDELEGLKPVMSCRTKVVQVKQVAAGSGISYGHTHICGRDTRIAVLPIGYSDGYLRIMSNRAEVLVKGKRAPVLGRICMNMCMVDITDIEDVAPGEDVVLLGHQGDDCIDADEIGGWGETISYEVLCALGNNNKRFIIEQL